MRSLLKIAFAAALGLGSVAAYCDMTQLDDDKLSDVTGMGNGIAFNLQMLINTDSSGNPVNASAAANTGCATNAAPCSYKLALQFENRPGTWLVLKDYYGMMSIPNLQLDAYVNPTSNTSYFNANRFISSPYQSTQTCIADIASCNPAGMSSFSFTFPGSTVNYSDMGLYMNIGRMAVEFDTCTSGATTVACTNINDTNNGWNKDARGSFAGLVVSDTTQKMAQINVNGRLRVYGF